MYKFVILHGEKFSLGGVDEIFFSRDELIQEYYTPFSMQLTSIWQHVFHSQVGRTERLDNTLNPQFSTAIIIDYFFEELQKLKFFIYDIDSSSMSLKSADFLGEMECTLGQVVYNFLYSATSMFNSLTTLNSKWINLKLHAEISQNNYS